MALWRSDKSGEERLRAENEFWQKEVEYIDFTLAFSRDQQTLREMMGSDRVAKYFAGPNAAAEKAYYDGEDQLYELFNGGQITDDEFEARHQRLDEEYKAALKNGSEE